MTDEEMLQQFIAYLKRERQYSNNTVSAYQRDLTEAQASFAKQQVDFKTASKREIEIYLQELASRGISRSSLARKLSSLRSFYKFLVKRELLSIDPSENIILRKGEKKLPQFFYPAEIKAVFNQLSGSDPLTVRNKALFSLFYVTGMRVSEVSNLKLEQLDLNMQLILVHGKGNKDRYVAIDDFAKQNLVAYLDSARSALLGQQTSSFVFLNQQGRRLTTRGIEYVMVQVFKKAGVGINVHPHELRHTFATQMLNNGADLRSVQELLGHANLSTTQIYTHVTMAHLQAEYQKFFPNREEKKE